MENYPKILVAIPYHKEKAYCLPQLMEAVDKLTYKNKEVVMRFDLEEYGGKDNVKKQREFFRELALSKGFEYLYFLGVDTIPPEDVLEKMLETIETQKSLIGVEPKIIGGVYWGRHNAQNGSPEGAVAWINKFTQEEQKEAFSDQNKVYLVDGMGMDSVLIHREVLNKVSFMSWTQNDDDYPFYDRAKELGYTIFLDTKIQCKHYFDNLGYTYLAKVYKTID